VAREWHPRGPLNLVGSRGEEPRSWNLQPGPWGLQAEPLLADEPHAEAWDLFREAERFLDLGRFDEATGRYEAARAALPPEAEPAALAIVLERYAEAMARLRRLDEARTTTEEALALHRSLASPGLGQAECRRRLAMIALSQQDQETARRHLADGLEIARAAAPASTEEAMILRGLALLAAADGDASLESAHLEQARGILERLDPEGLDLAHLYNNLGLKVKDRDPAQAEALYAAALAIKRVRVPGSASLGSSLVNLANLEMERGRLATAEAHLQEALQLFEAVGAAGGRVNALGNLGIVARRSGDLEAAERYQRQVVETFRELLPGSPSLAAALDNLSRVVHDREDLEEAEALNHEALGMLPEASDDPQVRLLRAAVLVNRGELALEAGLLDGAEQTLRQGLADLEAAIPGSLDVAETRTILARWAEAAGHREEAVAHHRQALAVRRALAPGSVAEAESLHALGTLTRDEGRLEEAIELFRAALDALERQEPGRRGAEDVRSRFGARHADFYRDLSDLQIRLGDPSAAFETFERSRARRFLALLAERDLDWTRDLDPELERRRRELSLEYERLLLELGASDPGSEQRGELEARLQESRLERERITSAVRQASPRLADLVYPEPAGLERIVSRLDPGTLLLAFSVGDSESTLYALTRDMAEPEIHRVPYGDEQLGPEVRRLLDFVRWHRPGDEAVIDALRARLGAWLLEPVASRLEGAARLLVVPDRSLQLLPFSLLPVPDGSPGYLVERLSVHYAPSLTTYLRWAEPGEAPASRRIVALAPAGEEDGPPRLRGTSLLGQLPESRREVDFVSDLFADRVEVLLGEEASESRVKGLRDPVEVLHFAGHARLDSLYPLDSALRLHPGVASDQDGWLRAWEILEQVRVPAELVTLAGCETGAGEAAAGEALLGLGLSFHHAGARSVLASLWAADDHATATLMRRFYEEIAAGRTKVEALRRAQLHLLSGAVGPDDAGRDHAHPFYWAGFQLSGAP
jgi:CHAT domain-containing protein/tetratricopeptide (TPR) repeat protein